MDDLINSFNNLSINDKSILSNVIKQNDNVDDLINSLNNLTIGKTENIQEEINQPIISTECKKVIRKMIDYFSILNNKERCFFKVNHEMPKWGF